MMTTGNDARTTPRAWKHRRLFQSLTTRFVALYILLVFIPTLIFIALYSRSLSAQQRSEARYKEQLLLNQTASFLGDTLSRGEGVVSAFQSENTLLDLLEGGFSTASEELMACITHVRPMMTSVLASYPVLRDVYVYRYRPSFLTNSDLVFNLPMIDQFPYNPGLLEASGGARGFLAADPTAVRQLDNARVNSSQFIYLLPLYNRGYSQAIGLLEVQVDIDRALAPLDIAQNGGGALYLQDGGTYYPIVRTAGGLHMDWTRGMDALPDARDRQTVRETVKGTALSLSYVFADAPEASAAIGGNVARAALLLLLPTLVVCVYVSWHASRLSRFGRHIRQTEKASPLPFPDKARGDELGDVIGAYNQMAETIHGLIAQVRQAEQLKNAATYYAMSSQVNPHFMFNTLENIRMQIEVEHYADASQMLFVLGRFLRYNISLRRESRLSDELTHIENYLMIYRYRVQALLYYTIDVAEGLSPADVRCPFCMLQPIVENCLKHGIRDDTPLEISVRIEPDGDDIAITVADNGSGMTQGGIDALNESLETPELREQGTDTHVGLGNVNARLKHFYGDAYGLTLTAGEAGGLLIRIRIGREPAPGALGGA